MLCLARGLWSPRGRRCTPWAWALCWRAPQSRCVVVGVRSGYSIGGRVVTEYWMVERDDGMYWDGEKPTVERLFGERYTGRSWAIESLRRRLRSSRAYADGHTWHLVHVRIRPPSERLYLAEKLAAWQPVVEAAEEMRARWDERASPAKQQDAQVAVVVACRNMPKKHKSPLTKHRR